MSKIKVKLLNSSGKESGHIELNPLVFGLDERKDILHTVTLWQLSKARSGCHKTKQRSEVAGSTRKIYKQKGTGGARHGSRKPSIFVGGGVTFGPVVRSHAYSLNKKVRKLGLRHALSARLSSITVIEKFDFEALKTQEMAKRLANFRDQKETSVLMISENFGDEFKKSVSNLKKVHILPVVGLNVVDVLKYETILIDSASLENIDKRLLV